VITPLATATLVGLLLVHVAVEVTSELVPPTVVAVAESVKVSPVVAGATAAFSRTAGGLTISVAVELFETQKPEQELHSRISGSTGIRQSRRREAWQRIRDMEPSEETL